jgi:adenylate cyclase
MTNSRMKSSLESVTALARGQSRTRFFLVVFLGIAGILFVINAVTLNTDPEASLAQRWWSLIPMSALVALGSVLAAKWFKLKPREVAAQRRLVATRALHEPWVAAHATVERILGRLASLPSPDGTLSASLIEGREKLMGLLEATVEGDETAELARRAAMIDTYRVALSTQDIDSLLKKDYLGSVANVQALDRTLELLELPEPRGGVASPGQTRPPARFESIAVLPFADLSPLGDQEYFSHGLADELITVLTKIRGLRVIARGLAFSFAEQDLSVREIGRRLGVETVLEGSVQKAGDRLRVAAQLIEVADGRELWSGDYDEELEDLFEIGNQLIEEVVQTLGVQTTADEKRAIEKPPTEVFGAYDFYLRGRRYFSQYYGRGMEFAVEMFSRAVDLDPGFALAWAGIADCCAFLFANSGRDPAYRDRALEASGKALELDPELPEAHVSRGVALSQGGRPEEAGQYFETALRLNPKLFEAHYFFARHHFTSGDAEKAIEFYESAAALRPEDYQVPLLSAQIYDDVGRAEDGRSVRERGVEVAAEHIRLNPDDARALYIGANGLVSLGRVDKGLEWARLAQRLQPNEPMTLYNLACVYSLAGEVDEAIECFANCVEHGFSYRDWAEHDSNLDAIRDDPRFVDIMARL